MIVQKLDCSLCTVGMFCRYACTYRTIRPISVCISMENIVHLIDVLFYSVTSIHLVCKDVSNHMMDMSLHVYRLTHF